MKKKPVAADPTEPTLENTDEVQTAKSVEKTEDSNIPQTTGVQPSIVTKKSNTNNNTSSSLGFLKTQTDSSAQLLGLGGCVIHATANSIVHDLKAGTASEALKTAVEKTVQHDEKNGQFYVYT